MQLKPFSFLVVLSNTYTTNLLYPGTRDGSTRAAVGWVPLGDPFLLIKHIRFMNNDSALRSVRLARGASGATPAATNSLLFDKNIPANDYIDYYPANLRLDGSVTTDYLVGGASAANVVTMLVEGEVGIA